MRRGVIDTRNIDSSRWALYFSGGYTTYCLDINILFLNLPTNEPGSPILQVKRWEMFFAARSPPPDCSGQITFTSSQYLRK